MIAFLRKLWGCVTVWHLKGTGLEGADVILTHAGGEARDGSPGAINAYLETVVRDLHSKTRLPIVAQGELARCIPDLPLYGKIPRIAEVGRYINTVDVARMHKQICDEHGWHRPILVCYQPHLWRGKMVTLKAGFTEVRYPETEAVYDRNCSQWWMASPLLNYPRELLVRLLWLIQGKI